MKSPKNTKTIHNRFLVSFGCLSLVLALNLSFSSSLKAQVSEPKISVFNERAHAGAEALMSTYDKQTGLFNTTGWWNSANAITTLADVTAQEHTKEFIPVFENTFVKAQLKFPNFRNQFYDDEGWWALAWIRVYDVTEDTKYLQIAKSIFQDMTGGWDTVCGGGLWWKKDRSHKNAIENELFLSVASELAARSEAREQEADLVWAKREWQWFNASGMINRENLINDGLDQACRNNGGMTWSYNQGVILSGLAGLGALTTDRELLARANQIATAAITHLTDFQRILHDHCEPDCGKDGVQFKGIFVRNLIALYQISPNPLYAQFLETNAESVWTKDRTKGNEFGSVWSGPPRKDDAGALNSAVDVLVATASLQERCEGGTKSSVQ